jgi:catechol 2,3-dioxygenase-like lactoylglutathione lyase family enzyme
MRIHLTSIFVNDQDKARVFYTDVLGFELRQNIPMGDYSWLTVGNPGEPGSAQIVLEPNVHPAVPPFTEALVADGIPMNSFEVPDVAAEYERLAGLGVVFTQPPTNMGPVTTAVFDDTVGNLLQIAQLN